MYCGGRLVEELAVGQEASTPAPATARRAAPPVCRPGGTKFSPRSAPPESARESASSDAGLDTSVACTALEAGPAAAPPPVQITDLPSDAASVLPFPDAVVSIPAPAEPARTGGAARSRSNPAPAGRPLPFTGPHEQAEEPQPFWKQVLESLFATRERIIVLGLVVFVAFGILGLNHLIETSRPPDNPGSKLVIDPGDAETPLLVPPGFALPPATEAEPPIEIRTRIIDRAAANLEQIAQALEGYAQDHNGLPRMLSDDLGELQAYGNMPSLLADFDGKKLSGYLFSSSPELRSETAVLTARPRETNEMVSRTLTFYRQN
jgi:hypothetical protein